MNLTRRHLQVTLGVLWLLDGALQLQPFMFTTGFATRVVAPVAQGQPAFVADPVRWASSLIASHSLVTDVIFAAVQIGIGIGLLSGIATRAALAASMSWAMGVWYFGEGLGGLASGHGSMLGGAPGAAVLYAILSGVAWPGSPDAGGADRRRLRSRLGCGGSRVAPRSWTVAAWAALWSGGALLQALPGQASPNAIRQVLLGTSVGAPRWLATTDRTLASAVHHLGRGLIPVVAALYLTIGLTALKSGWPRLVAVVAGTGTALGEWVFGQGMGQIYTGQATDPNAGLLFVVLAGALLATNRRHRCVDPVSGLAGWGRSRGRSDHADRLVRHQVPARRPGAAVLHGRRLVVGAHFSTVPALLTGRNPPGAARSRRE